MKSNARWVIALTVFAGAYLSGVAHCAAATSKEAAEAAAMMSSYEAQEKAAAAVRAKDPAWKPSTVELAKLEIGDKRSPGSLKNFCLNAEGNILACYGSAERGHPNLEGLKKTPGSLKVYSPKGELLKTMALEINPAAVAVSKEGAIFVAGDGKLQKLDAEGKVLASAVSPVAGIPVVITKEVEEMLKQSGRTVKEQLEGMKTMLDQRRADVTGLAVTGQDVFMVVPTPNEFTYQVYRFDQALQNPKLVVEKLRGCCGQMDLQAQDGKLWIPHNARHAIEARDRDGKEITKFGTAGKVKATDFGGCCEPKNLRVLANGDILAAESGPPTCIKRFSATGKFIEVVALVDGPSECVRVTVGVSPDGSRFYLLDTKNDAIRVFGPKS
jgi:sugar lactone lactonase YvrE